MKTLPAVCEAVIKKLSTNKSPVWVASQVNFIKHQDKLTPILLKLFQKTQKEGRLPSSFFKDSTTLIVKPDNNTTKKENFKSVYMMNVNAKILNKIIAN